MAQNVPIRRISTGTGKMIGYNTLLHMAQIIRDSAKNYQVIEAARDIVAGCEWRDFRCEILAIYAWVQGHSRYVYDPYGLELIVTPKQALDMIASGKVFSGDCDDLTVLSLSLLRAIGYPSRIRAVAYPSMDRPNELSHVYGLVQAPQGAWISIDEIRKPGGYPGYEKPGATRVVDWEV